MEEPLRVGELIKELKKLPEDLVVVTPDMEQRKSDYFKVFSVRIIKATENDEWGIRWESPRYPFKPWMVIKEYALLDWSEKYRTT